MPGYDFFMKPKTQQISVSLEEVHNNLYSLLLIDHYSEFQGLNPSLSSICHNMSDRQKRINHLVMNGLYYAAIPDKREGSFEEYLEELENVAPQALADKILGVYLNLHETQFGTRPSVGEMLNSEESYLDFLSATFGEAKIDRDIEREAYGLITAPRQLKSVITGHLREMWDLFLREEWDKTRPLLTESVSAYQSSGVESLAKLDAVKTLGCDSMDCNWEHLSEKVEKAKRLFLVPSAHLGPYMGKMFHFDTDELWIFYGTLLPEGDAGKSPELSKADLLVRLGALTDGSRLEILKICSGGGEFSSVELMNRLGISQSAVSRHLKQLSATGYLKERRENSSKYYCIDKKKIKNTFVAFAGYLDLDSD